ncbi:hypothetical protein [Streptomyces tropicalis]|uniref:Uncharacterized protein n=1 Tax=Streptomyces tropicalis TaxID=3034234 RepID=A0ABT6ADK6_9ACTN|nr:hypothetical protein [Streptomyces tropicalis]MDF3302734.1 hypothetical protein [Streptomyces tropicalis]
MSTSLVITGQEVNSTFLITELQLTDSEEFSSSKGVDTYSSPGWATLTVDERHSKSVDEQAEKLIGLLSRRKPALDALKEAGKSVKVDLAGIAEESGTGLLISPGVLAGLAELEVPVTFTTVRESGEDEEDPLAWLD